MRDDLQQYAPEVDLPLDPGIREAVLILRRGGVETFESCEGGDGHAFPDPTIKFHGSQGAGFHALAVALDHGLPVNRLQRCYHVNSSELSGPWWELVFHPTVRHQDKR
jgi:hypothetical protein